MGKRKKVQAKPGPGEAPNYLPEVLAAARSTPRGQVRHVHVYHDAWCAVFRGGVCNCNPQVVVVKEAGHGEGAG